ncbi:MAG TPA: carboxypeptidase-like regulatory domain-containing protein [Prolixibacteraceae bacterium]|nr:carboxypeptidase-like regulatory domain-containing protein [Prolixibacteraceae bacterium]
MKYIYAILVCLATFPSIAQISGQVIDVDSVPVKYAAVVNVKNNIGCISDSLGFFSLNALQNDSISIRCIGFQADTFPVSKNFEKYILTRKIYDLNEVVVSKDYAALLYFISYKNLIAKLKKESRDRFYCNAVSLLNRDTLQTMYLDLDFEQKITRNAPELLIHNRFVEIQNKSTIKELLANSFMDYNLRLGFLPKVGFPRLFLTQNKEEAINSKYVFQIASDSLFMKVRFTPITSATSSSKVFEATIFKKDTCLVAFAVTSYPNSNFKWKDKNNKPDQLDQSTYFRMSNEDGFYYISEIYSCVNLYYSTNAKVDIAKYAVRLKNYCHAKEKLKKRFGTYFIDNYIVFKKDKKSNYSSEFWKDNAFPLEIPSNFE